MVLQILRFCCAWTRSTIICLCLVCSFSFAVVAQQIDYAVPSDFSDAIPANEYGQLVDESVRLIRQRFTVTSVQGGTVFLKDSAGVGSGMRINLDNVVLKWIALADQADRLLMVQGHFDNLFSSLTEQAETNADDFASVRDKLALRIYPVGSLPRLGGAGNLVCREDLEGTQTVLVLDLEGAFVPVRREQFRKWKTTEAYAFEAAQQGVNKQDVQVVKADAPTPSGPVALYLLGNEDYAASYVLDLQRNKPELVGEWGSVIAVPNKGIADIHPIRKEKAIDFVLFIQTLLPVVEKFHAEHPQPISMEFFWYYKGRFKKIDVRRDATGTVIVTTPIGLADLMAAETR